MKTPIAVFSQATSPEQLLKGQSEFGLRANMLLAESGSSHNTMGPPISSCGLVNSPPDIVLLFETISINDLEMAGVLLEQWLALEELVPDLTLANVGIQCDNSSTVHWSRKFSARSFCAGYLLRALALRQQQIRK